MNRTEVAGKPSVLQTSPRKKLFPGARARMVMAISALTAIATFSALESLFWNESVPRRPDAGSLAIPPLPSLRTFPAGEGVKGAGDADSNVDASADFFRTLRDVKEALEVARETGEDS